MFREGFRRVRVRRGRDSFLAGVAMVPVGLGRDKKVVSRCSHAVERRQGLLVLAIQHVYSLDFGCRAGFGLGRPPWVVHLMRHPPSIVMDRSCDSIHVVWRCSYEFMEDPCTRYNLLRRGAGQPKLYPALEQGTYSGRRDKKTEV